MGRGPRHDGGTLLKRIDYKYDVFNHLIQEAITVSGASTTRFVWDGDNLYAVLDGSNTLVQRNLTMDGTSQYAGRQIQTGQTHAGAGWFLTDRQFSVRGITDGSGTVQDQLTFDGTGKVTAETGPTWTDYIQWTGQYRDINGTLYQNNLNRWYDPATQKWLEEDPVRFGAGDANLSRPIRNNFLNTIDPTGLEPGLPLKIGDAAENHKDIEAARAPNEVYDPLPIAFDIILAGLPNRAGLHNTNLPVNAENLLGSEPSDTFKAASDAWAKRKVKVGQWSR